MSEDVAAARLVGEEPPERGQYPVTYLMSVTGVDLLHAVQVNDHDRQRSP